MFRRRWDTGPISVPTSHHPDFDTFLRVASVLNSSLELDAVLRELLTGLENLLQPTHWSLLLKDEASGELVFTLARGDVGSSLRGHRLAPGEGIAGWVAAHDRPLLLPDVASDARFSARMDELRHLLQKVAATDFPVLVHGESGTGKELVARCIHRNSSRGKRAFVKASLAVRSGLPEAIVDKMVDSKSAKGLTALAWKAGMDMRFAVQLQTRVAGIPPNKTLNPRNGTDFPLSEQDLNWQIEFFGG